jgi:arsenate reductase
MVKYSPRVLAASPAGQVHPLSILHLRQAGINTDNLVSQSWDELESFAPDVVVTVCDSAAAESCPLWFGTAIKLHWGLADPSKVIGTSDEISQAFNSTINEISSRVEQLLSLHHNLSDRQALRAELTAFGAN